LHADTSKFLVVTANMQHLFYRDLCLLFFFYIGGKITENVMQYTHVGHIITSSVDTDYMIHKCNCFAEQANNVLFFFSELDMLVKLKLFKSYAACVAANGWCTVYRSMYGYELWVLSNVNSEVFCTA
jgi:hypothetical protein